MYGVPKHFNTLQDIKNSMAVEPEGTKAKLKELLANRFLWLEVEELKDGEDGITDETHKVVEMPEPKVKYGTDDSGEEVLKRYQFELREDPNAHIFRLGATVEYIESLIGAN